MSGSVGKAACDKRGGDSATSRLGCRALVRSIPQIRNLNLHRIFKVNSSIRSSPGMRAVATADRGQITNKLRLLPLRGARSLA